MTQTTQETNRGFYDRISSAYDFIADSNEHKAREAGEQLLQLQPGERVLEIGFGTGNILLNLAKAVSPGGRVTGLDVSPGMLKVAQQKLDKTGMADVVELCVGDARKLPFEDGSFDAAFASFTLELFAKDEIPGVLRELKRVLKPGGRLGVVSMATVREGNKASMLEKTYVWMHRHFPHIVDCQPIDVEAFLRDAGFALRDVKDIEIWTMPVRAAVGVRE